MKSYWSWMWLGVALAATGCFGLKPARDSTRHLLLSAPGTEDTLPAPAAGTAGAGFALGLAAVGLPAYLDSPWVVVRHGANEIRYSATYRWGERPEQGVRRVLALQLERWLAPARVEARSWKPDAVTWELTVEFEHCEVATDGRVFVEGHWRVSRPLSAEVIRHGAHRVESGGPPPEEDPSGAAAALSAALAEFARQMAEALRPTAS